MNPPFNVLYLCTGNSARSVIAEALTNHLGAPRVRAYSAGSFPTGRVNPAALALLRSEGISTDGLRSKSWDEFARPSAPAMDIVITVCDNAAGEVCPIWPGGPVAAHWGVDDPAAVTGSPAEVERAFERARTRLGQRIARLLALPLEQLDRGTLAARLREIVAE